MHSRVAVTALAAAVSLTSLAMAQVPDSTPFHRGQWGVDFGIGAGFAAIGALHFTSPTHAMLLNLTSVFGHGSSAIGGPPTITTSNVNAGLSVGTRAYRAVDARVYRWTTLGLSMAYNRQTTTVSGVSQRLQGIGAGVFGNLGAAWLVTPHLGLGAQWQVTVNYTHTTLSGTGSGSSNALSIGLGQVSLTGQFYF